ncbi:hypothetical protein CDD83_392 [Cordyceps sp. RAO-2017]|nr:hypothetical protein CDD83_392 [Cordyceps sp. RAO-2017]
MVLPYHSPQQQQQQQQPADDPPPDQQRQPEQNGGWGYFAHSRWPSDAAPEFAMLCADLPTSYFPARASLSGQVMGQRDPALSPEPVRQSSDRRDGYRARQS